MSELNHGEIQYSRPDSRAVVERAMGELLVYPDVQAMNPGERLEYAQNARLILESKVFQHEIGTLINTFVRSIAVRAGSFDEVRDLRMCINALELLKERLEEIAVLSKHRVDDFDPHALI